MSKTPDLGRLESVDLRSEWDTEGSHFTPWLAREENLTVLGDTINIELQLEAKEQPVGPFRADILCTDVSNGSQVLIENQLERTDHTHLGQLMTYAAGLHTVTIVWIAARFTDEHRAALDWLNEITADDISFFGLEVELWRIGNSPPAPKFNVVSKPNNWSRSVSQAARSIAAGELSETKQLQLEYWGAFKEYADANSTAVRPTKPLPQHWMNLAIGRSNFLNNALINTREKRIGTHLVVLGADAKAHFHLLHAKRDQFEADAGEQFDWRELPDGIESHVFIIKENVDPTDRDDWPNQHQWLLEKLELIDRVFRSAIRELDASDWQSDEVDANE